MLSPYSGGSGVCTHIVLTKPFLENVSSWPQKIDVAPLTSELEDCLFTLTELGRRGDSDLVVALDSFREHDKVGRGDQLGELGVGRDLKVCFERY